MINDGMEIGRSGLGANSEIYDHDALKVCSLQSVAILTPAKNAGIRDFKN